METNKARTNKRPHNLDNDGVTGKRIKAEVVDNGSDGKVPTTCVQKFQDVDVNQTLRQAVSNWFKQYMKITGLNAESCLADLVKLQDMGDGDWRKHTLPLREVQKRITWVVQAMRDIGRRKREIISTALRKILQPEHEITPSMFPNIKEITEIINIKSYTVNQYVLDRFKHLPNLLKEILGSAPDTAQQLTPRLRGAQWRLEATIRAYSQGVDNIYHYLVCVGVLRLFGFKVNGFFFEHDLCKKDFDNIIDMLDAHIRTFDSLHRNVQLQAYVLGLALCFRENRETFIQFILDRLQDKLSPELGVISNTNRNKEIQNRITELLPTDKEHLKVSWKSLLFGLKDQLRLFSRLDEKIDPEPDWIGERLSDSLEDILNLLSMTKYYPQKLTYEDVIKLTGNVKTNGDTVPTTLPELPWYFVKHIVALDSETREECHVPRNQDDDSGSSSDSDGDVIKDIHPLDLVCIVYKCADDFLRQELADKMVKCQYAVPFILPPEETSNKSKNLILLWALKSITRNFYHNGNVMNQTLIEVEAPVVVCMHSGGETTWKSRIVNKMLSPQQQTFWHRGLGGGDCVQLCSRGMVEVAWYLPGRQEKQNIFSHPVTFLNLRMDIEPSDVVCDKLYEFSSLCCVFATEIDNEIKEFLRKKTVLSKVVLIILHREGEEKEVRQACKELAATFDLQKHQIIRKTAEEGNINGVFKQLQSLIEQNARTTGTKHSLSTFTHVVGSEMEVDNKKCWFVQMAAESILKDTDEYYTRDAINAKSEILPYQSDIKLRQKMSKLDKELSTKKA